MDKQSGPMDKSLGYELEGRWFDPGLSHFFAPLGEVFHSTYPCPPNSI